LPAPGATKSNRRAKERIFSFRNAHRRRNPKGHRPEPWRLYNGRKRRDEMIWLISPLSPRKSGFGWLIR
jgi:hypothetical protein